MPNYIKGAKIALLDFNLQRHKLALGVQVSVGRRLLCSGSFWFVCVPPHSARVRRRGE